MKINKFKLHDSGFSGLTAEGVDVVTKGRVKVYCDHSVTFKLPITDELRSALQNLRYHFFWLTSYMHDELIEFIDEGILKDLKIPKSEGLRQKLYLRAYSIYESTEITAITKNGQGELVLTGTIRTIANKKRINISTAPIADSDDYFEYNKLLEGCDTCFKMVSDFISNDENFEPRIPKQYFDHKYNNDDNKLYDIKSKNKVELAKVYSEELQNMGCIVIPPENLDTGTVENVEKKKSVGMPRTL